MRQSKQTDYPIYRFKKKGLYSNLAWVTFAILLSTINPIQSQVLISNSSGTPDNTAMLEVKSTSKGLLPPRMTADQRNSIENPTPGLIIYCIDCLELQMFNDTAWTNLIGLPANPGFTCGDLLYYGGQGYATVSIDAQCWMAENLNIGAMISGASTQTNNSTMEKYCYDNNPTNCTTYGGLYQWDEMMQYTTIESSQGICPTGWHLPSDDEIKTLELTLGMVDVEMIGYRGTDQGSQMASNEPLWTDGALDQNAAFGSSGFAALPGGAHNSNDFFNESNSASLWSSSESGVSAWDRYVDSNSSAVYRATDGKSFGLSVRCLQD